ncbi:hypothetical protein RQP46_007122 [Phenoliferia psychrophenolica]
MMEASSTDALLEEYTALVPQLQATPFSRELHLEHIRIASLLGLTDELEQARELLLSYFPLLPQEWLDWIATRHALVAEGEPGDLEPHINLIELYKRAVQDCHAIPLLQSYSKYYIESHYASLGLAPPAQLDGDAADDDDEDEAMTDLAARKVAEPDLILAAAFGIDDVRTTRDEIMEIADRNIAKSQLVWGMWKAFEVDLTKLDKTPEQLKQLSALYLARLKVPHIGIEDTFTAYSSFVTREDNAHYATLLPAANKLYAPALALTTEREPQEAQLAKHQQAEWAYVNYVKWELEVKSPNVPLVIGLLDRAVEDHPVSAELWDIYLDFCYGLPKAKLATLLLVADRAVKHLPASGELWATYFRALEKTGQGAEAIEALFARAMSTGLLDKDVEALVAVFEARAGFHRREIDELIKDQETLEPDMIDPVVDILEEGIEAVKKAHRKGDQSSRLEKHLLRMYERFGRLEEASELWAKLVKQRPHSYATHYGYADFETRLGSPQKAFEIYKEGCSQKGLDYPEYLLEAWLVFVRQNGSFGDFEYTLARIKKQKKGLEGKRAREAAAAAAAEPVASTSASVAQPVAATVAVEQQDAGKKRERSPVAEISQKKAKVDAATPAAAAADEPKRDRENCTVIVLTASETEATEDDIKALFKDCGEIRELKVKTIGAQGIAMIEFMERDSVLAAQTKDKKKINGVEVDVHIAWRSCLYVTNFPEEYDKAAVEALFSNYGTIFDTRWPSKRYKTNRRFCYVQFTSPESAEASLALHDKELENGFKLQVAISDPSARKGRTDTDANQKELYVAGLSKFVKEFELKKLFEPFGAIKRIHLPMDDKGEGKGFAFVEFEDADAAKASLSLNNHELKKRHMSVTVAQHRVTGVQKTHAPEARTDVQGRSVRVRGIKPGTEEAIVQQAFAKFASVRVVQMTPGSTEAVVELDSVAEAGKILMSKDAILVDEVPVEISAIGRQVRGADGQKPAGAGTGTDRLMPRQASRGRGRVGLAALRVTMEHDLIETIFAHVQRPSEEPARDLLERPMKDSALADLRSAALVSKAFLPHARARLYDSLVLKLIALPRERIGYWEEATRKQAGTTEETDPARKRDNVVPDQTSDKLLLTLILHPHLAALARRLHVSLTGLRQPPRDPLFAIPVATVLRACPSIEEVVLGFELDWFDDFKPIGSVITGTCPLLTHLAITSATPPEPTAFAATLRDLPSLSILSVGTIKILPIDVTNPPTFHLQRLTIEYDRSENGDAFRFLTSHSGGSLHKIQIEASPKQHYSLAHITGNIDLRIQMPDLENDCFDILDLGGAKQRARWVGALENIIKTLGTAPKGGSRTQLKIVTWGLNICPATLIRKVKFLERLPPRLFDLDAISLELDMGYLLEFLETTPELHWFAIYIPSMEDKALQEKLEQAGRKRDVRVVAVKNALTEIHAMMRKFKSRW